MSAAFSLKYVSRRKHSLIIYLLISATNATQEQACFMAADIGIPGETVNKYLEACNFWHREFEIPHRKSDVYDL